jgi:hypothetical protein
MLWTSGTLTRTLIARAADVSDPGSAAYGTTKMPLIKTNDKTLMYMMRVLKRRYLNAFAEQALALVLRYYDLLSS